LSTRIRLARNLQGYVFGQRARDADRMAVLARVTEASAASDRLGGAVTFRLDELERVERQLLHERHLVSKELAGLERDARPRPGAALLVQGPVGVMVMRGATPGCLGRGLGLGWKRGMARWR